MKEYDLTDVKKLTRWLEKQSPQVRSAVSSRAALRVLANIKYYAIEISDELLISAFRAVLISVCHASGHRPLSKWGLHGRLAGTRLEIIARDSLVSGLQPYCSAMSAALSAKSIKYNFASETASAIDYAIKSGAVERKENTESRTHLPVTYKTSASGGLTASVNITSNLTVYNDSEIRSRIASDINNTNQKFTPSLWDEDSMPSKLQDVRITFVQFLNEDIKWKFWTEWYLAVWEGQFQNWELAFEVVNIEDEVWDQGPQAVAKEIERIQAEHFTKAHPLAETIDINPDTGRFFSTPVPVQNTPLIGALLSQVQDSLEDATLGSNGLNEASRETRVLTRTLTRYANDPQRIEMDFTSVAVGLRRQIHDTGELPNSEDNLALLTSVEDGVRGIRAAHPDVAENRLILAQQSMRELPQDKIELLEDALPMLVAMSEDAMAEDFAADIPSLINDALLPLPNGAPPLAGADVSTRIFTRVSHMRLMYDQFVDAGSKAFDSKTFKTARFGFTVTAMLSGLVSLAWLLFGVI